MFAILEKRVVAGAVAALSLVANLAVFVFLGMAALSSSSPMVPNLIYTSYVILFLSSGLSLTTICLKNRLTPYGLYFRNGCIFMLVISSSSLIFVTLVQFQNVTTGNNWYSANEQPSYQEVKRPQLELKIEIPDWIKDKMEFLVAIVRFFFCGLNMVLFDYFISHLTCPPTCHQGNRACGKSWCRRSKILSRIKSFSTSSLTA